MKIKSLRGVNVEVIVPNKVKRPHAGSVEERVQYDQLIIIEWVAGFCRITRKETDLETRDHF